MTINGKLYKLVGENTSDRIRTSQLIALISTVAQGNQTITNRDENTRKNWYSATWKTAASDFKTRKFKCNGIEYSDTTGYVSKLVFEEI